MTQLKKRSSLFTVLVCLTLLSISVQLSFFAIHVHATSLTQTLFGGPVPADFLHAAVLLPLMGFIGIQILAYLLFVSFIWFASVSCGELFRHSNYGLGVFLWFVFNLALFLLNGCLFPDSFFAKNISQLLYVNVALWASLLLAGSAVVLAYYFALRRKRRRRMAFFFLSLTGLCVLLAAGNHFAAQGRYRITGTAARPNIILIGLDSLRPDYTGYQGLRRIQTPNIDQFLKTGLRFSEAYTPLARTFPAWVSILTGKHPKNSFARINLNDPARVVANDNLAKRLQAANYETLYATDEKRFSNITPDYGFDRVLGPRMGWNDFMLGSLSDFPLTNLLINLPWGRFLFPFNYANRAAAITYQPDTFLELVQAALRQRSDRPLFLAIHLCVTHWPFTWANEGLTADWSAKKRYQTSVEKVDQQLGQLLHILKANGLLENSLVILLSDHGTTFGQLGDRMIDKEHYLGAAAKLKWMKLNKIDDASQMRIDPDLNYSLSTAYGQGTDVLSLKQHQIVLAFKYFAEHASGAPPLFLARGSNLRTSLLDLAPTILDFLKLPALPASDGLSLLPYLGASSRELGTRPLFLETADSFSDLETSPTQAGSYYETNPRNGLVSVKACEEAAVLHAKQRAVLLGPWLLAQYPPSPRQQLVHNGHFVAFKTYFLPAYYVLANLQTGQWAIDFDNNFARSAPLAELKKKLHDFYGKELL